MNKFKSIYKTIISLTFIFSFVLTSTAAFSEIVGRLSVHWSPNTTVQNMHKYLLMKLIKEQKEN